MLKLLLIQPPVEDFYDTDIRLQPLGLCYLKAAVRKYHPDIEVVIKDYHQGWGRKTIPIPKELAYLKPYYAWPDQSPFSTFHQYYHFGAAYLTIAREVAEEHPDLVGISSLFSPYYREVLKCAAAIREMNDVPILLGGSHVSCCPVEMLSDPNVDFVIRGEGEKPLVELLDAWMHGTGYENVANLGFKKEGEMVFNKVTDNYPINDLPIPDFSDLSPSRYLYEKKPITFLITSRGCPHRCSFCSVNRTFGKKYRRRTSESIIEEMEKRYAEGYRVFDFEDDNLTFDQAAVKELCLQIMTQFKDREVQLLAMNGISYKSLNKDSLELMRKAGFTRLNLALVSADRTVLKDIRRPHSVEQFSEVVDQAFTLGFTLLAHQILGLPNDSIKGMIDTMIFLARHPVLIGVSVFYLTPGSGISSCFPQMHADDIFKSRSTAMAITDKNCARDALNTLFICARILNFIKGLTFDGERAGLIEILQPDTVHEPRTRSGIMLFEKLLKEKCLYAIVNRGLKPVEKFDGSLFFRIFKELQWLRTQEGKIVYWDKVL